MKDKNWFKAYELLNKRRRGSKLDFEEGTSKKLPKLAVDRHHLVSFCERLSTISLHHTYIFICPYHSHQRFVFYHFQPLSRVWHDVHGG